MNRYDHTFEVVCPKDGATVGYHLEVESDTIIYVEDIIEACRFTDPYFHETVADFLFEKLGGAQTLRATHSGIQVTTKRGISERDKDVEAAFKFWNDVQEISSKHGCLGGDNVLEWLDERLR